jgi:hypothetical protein
MARSHWERGGLGDADPSTASSRGLWRDQIGNSARSPDAGPDCCRSKIRDSPEKNTALEWTDPWQDRSTRTTEHCTPIEECQHQAISVQGAPPDETTRGCGHPAQDAPTIQAARSRGCPSQDRPTDQRSTYRYNRGQSQRLAHPGATTASGGSQRTSGAVDRLRLI